MEGIEDQQIPSNDEVTEVVQVEEEGLKDEITKDIESSRKPKKPRSEAQKAAFEKARKALAEKRQKAKEAKELKKNNKAVPRRPPKTKASLAEPEPDPDPEPEPEPEVVKRPTKKQKKE